MATEAVLDKNEMNYSDVNGTNNGHNDSLDNRTAEDIWGFPLEDLYKLALAFYREKEGKAMQLTYKDKLKLVSYTKQVAHGKYRADISPDVGFLNVVGNDRRLAWQGLGDLSREDAMSEFIKYQDSLCPLFRPYLAAHKAEKEEQERRRKEEEERLRREEEEKERQRQEEEARLKQEEEQNRQRQQEAQIRSALNQQTAAQFRQYVEQQYPGNPQQQEVLIAQLQEQHYQQYMQQVYQQQLLHQQQQYNQLQAMSQPKDLVSASSNPSHTPVPPPADLLIQQKHLQQHQHQQQNIPHYQTELGSNGQPPLGFGQTPQPIEGHQILTNGDTSPLGTQEDDEDNDTDHNELPPIAAASMWTRKDIKEFKDSIRKDPDSVIKVGSGETVTVRVPTHEDGTCLFWEFATDSYDLGFGVYFEWTIAPNNQVSVHVSESSDEEELEEEEGAIEKGDIEKGAASKKDNRPPTDEIIPVYRRDSHEEVYCGSHMYPGRGVYLLKFDNSYSLWRSKTLYYRVYYTRWDPQLWKMLYIMYK